MMRLIHAAALSVALTSHVSHYTPHTMERVSVNRGLPLVGCMVASMDYPIRTWLRVHSLTTGRTLICRVTDTVARQDRDYHIRHNIRLEIGFRNIGSLCGLTRYGQEPPSACSVVIRRMS